MLVRPCSSGRPEPSVTCWAAPVADVLITRDCASTAARPAGIAAPSWSAPSGYRRRALDRRGTLCRLLTAALTRLLFLAHHLDAPLFLDRARRAVAAHYAVRAVSARPGSRPGALGSLPSPSSPGVACAGPGFHGQAPPRQRALGLLESRRTPTPSTTSGTGTALLHRTPLCTPRGGGWGPCRSRSDAFVRRPACSASVPISLRSPRH